MPVRGNAPPEVPLAPEHIAQLQDEGYVLVKQILPAGVLDRVRDALTSVVDRMAQEWLQEGAIERLCEDSPFDVRWARIRQQLPALRPVTWRRVLVSQPMYELWRRPELTGRIRTVLGDELWAHDTWNGRPREPHAPVQRIGWHQDTSYLRGWEPADGHILTCWIPLVPVDATSGCLQIMPGSHRSGLLPAKDDRYHNLNIPNIHLRQFTPTTIPAEPGDVLIFTERTVHRALDNVSDYVRWTVDIRFAADNAANRRKARGGFLCRTAHDPSRIESYPEWAGKYDVRTGVMGPELRAIDFVADRSGPMGRDIRTF